MSLKVTWYSHASFLIETAKARLLVDPFITLEHLPLIVVSTLKREFGLDLLVTLFRDVVEHKGQHGFRGYSFSTHVHSMPS